MNRDELNHQRLAKLHPEMARKVAGVLKDLEFHDWQPLIDMGVHRTPEQQAQMVRRGVSKVRYSFHNCTSKNGQPESLAADITDLRWGWQSPRRFWLHLASSAESHG